MKKKIFHNWSLKLASLILASVIWFLVAKIGDPTDTVTFYNVPVKLTNTELLDKENKVFEVLDKTDSVRVSVKAPRSVTSKLRLSDIIAEADVSKLTDINTIEIAYSVPMVVEEVKGDHDSVRLSVEERATKWIRVQHHTDGEVAESYIVAGATLDQNRIEVTGPKSAVEQISYAGIGVDVTGATSNVSLNVEPEFYNAHGDLLTFNNVTRNVERVHVEVEVLSTKEVPIVLQTMGVPAEGYMATGKIESSIDSIVIAGKQSVLNSISKIEIPEDELNLTGESSDMVNIINLKDYLPENVRFADSSFNGRITVTVFIEELVDKTIQVTADKISITDLPAGYSAEITDVEENHMLTVTGLAENVSAISSSSVNGVIKISDWISEKNIDELKPGTYGIKVNFNLPDRVIMKNNVTVKVTISKVED